VEFISTKKKTKNFSVNKIMILVRYSPRYF